MYIIAFDLSTTHIGWCALRNGEYDVHKEITLRGSFAERMAAAFTEIDGVCAFATPDDRIAIETPFVGKNYKTALQLGLMRGLAWAVSLERFGTPPIEITPAEAKLALTGHGAASKQDMMTFARLQSGVALGEHAADALGVGIAAWGRWRVEQLDD